MPVDLAKAVVTALFVKTQVRIRDRHAQHFYLRNRVVDKTLAKFVIAEAFDFPGEAAGAVRRVVIVWAEHHQSGPPEAVNGVLQHLALGVTPLRKRHTGFKALTLVETLFFTDFHHRAGIGAI